MASDRDKEYGLMAAVAVQTNKFMDPPEDYEPTYPNLVFKELLMGLAIIILLHVIAVAFNAPLEEIANPELTPSPAKAPWYFLGLQELLHYAPPVVAGVAVPAVLLGSLMVIPLFQRRWVLLPVFSMFAVVLAPLFDSAFYRSQGLVTLLVYGALMAAAWLWLLNRRTLDQRPQLLARIRNVAFLVFVLYFSTLTAIGTFFRGAEWKWVWPWAGGG